MNTYASFGSFSSNQFVQGREGSGSQRKSSAPSNARATRDGSNSAGVAEATTRAAGSQSKGTEKTPRPRPRTETGRCYARAG
jgi:hypothetical protein